VPLAADVAQVDAHLAVVEFAQPAAPLALHADRLAALLGEGGGVEDEDRVGLAQLCAHLACQLIEQGLVVPVGLAEELLESLALAVVQVGDALGVLAGQVGEQPLDVVPGVGTLLGGEQRLCERLQEGLQPAQRAAQQSGGDLGVGQQLAEAHAEASLHWPLLSARAGLPRGIVRQRLAPGQARDTVELLC